MFPKTFSAQPLSNFDMTVEYAILRACGDTSDDFMCSYLFNLCQWNPFILCLTIDKAGKIYPAKEIQAGRK